MSEEKDPSHPENENAQRVISSDSKPKKLIPAWAKLAAMAIVLAFATIGLWTSSPTTTPQELEEAINGDTEARAQAPDIEVTTESGGKLKLSSLKGQVVLLSFWASWCAPCLVELPSFGELHERLSDKGLKVVPINLDNLDEETKEFIGRFWKRKSLPFSTTFDQDKAAARTFEVDILPANFVIDRKGRIVASSFGANDWASNSAVELVESVLKEKN